jgi:hypothetical protein
MASGSGLATALAALKGHAVAAAVVGTLVVGGSAAAAVAVTTGVVQLPGAATLHGQNGNATEAPNSATPHTAAACANSGDAARLAAIFAPMFGGGAAGTSAAQTEICTLFVGSDGHAFGFGEIQQVLEITAAIEANGGKTACLTGSAAHGQGSGNSGQPSFTAPSSGADATMTIIGDVRKAVQQGTPLAQLARDCDAAHVTGNPGGGQGQPTGTPGAKPTGTPGAKPTGTPGAKPTGTPGRP